MHIAFGFYLNFDIKVFSRQTHVKQAHTHTHVLTYSTSFCYTKPRIDIFAVLLFGEYEFMNIIFRANSSCWLKLQFSIVNFAMKTKCLLQRWIWAQRQQRWRQTCMSSNLVKYCAHCCAPADSNVCVAFVAHIFQGSWRCTCDGRWRWRCCWWWW